MGLKPVTAYQAWEVYADYDAEAPDTEDGIPMLTARIRATEPTKLRALYPLIFTWSTSGSSAAKTAATTRTPSPSGRTWHPRGTA